MCVCVCVCVQIASVKRFSCLLILQVMLYYTQIALVIAGPTARWTNWTSAFALSPTNSSYFTACIFKGGVYLFCGTATGMRIRLRPSL